MKRSNGPRRRSGRTLSAQTETQIRAAIAHTEAGIMCMQECVDKLRAALNTTGSPTVSVEDSWAHAPLH